MTDLLRDLTPGRAFVCFCIALAAGSVAIVMDLPWLRLSMPSAAMLVYGVLLLVAQRQFHVSHSYEVKTSPYILGFILTLVALFHLFWRFGSALTSAGVDTELISSHAGTAILTTVAGLLLRQTLIALDPDEHRQDEALRSLSQTLRKHATEFDRSQKAFVSLIKEFVGTREQLFRQEEDTFRRYVSQIERSVALVQQFNDGVSPAVAQITEHFDKLQTGIVGLSRTVDETTAGAEGLTRHLTHVSRGASAATEQLLALQENLSGLGVTVSPVAAEIQELGSKVAAFKNAQAQLFEDEEAALRTYVAEIQRGTEAFRQLHGAAGPNLTALTRHLDEWQATVRGSNEAADNLRTSFASAAAGGATLAERLGEMESRLTELVTLQERATTVIGAIVTDLEKIDSTVDDVARLLAKRIREE